MASIPGYLTIKDLQSKTGLSRSTLLMMLRTCKLPSKRMGGRLILVPEAALADYLASLPAAF